MPNNTVKCSVSLNKNLRAIIKEMENEQKKKFSHICSELIEVGLKNYTSKEKQYDFLKEITLKNYENILSTLNLLGELFRIAKDVSSKRFNADQSIDHIFTTIQATSKKMADKKRCATARN